MGRRDRERVARIQAGEEKPMSTRTQERVEKVGTAYLQRLSTSSQVQFLADSLHSGKLPPNRLRKELMNNAPKEMNKGAKKLIKQGKTPTIDLLMKDYWEDKAFQALASEVGLDEEWFVELAKQEVENKKWS